MRRLFITVTAFALLPGITECAEPPPLDEEFLDYLAEFEGQSDNWTWFADDDKTPAKEDKTPPAKRTTDVKK